MIFWLGAWGSTNLAAQEPASFGEVIDVELVNVDVWVTDADGQPVRGLSRDDLRVRHNGDRVEVTYFEELLTTPASASIGTGSTEIASADRSGAGIDIPSATAPASLILYYDETRTHPAHVPALIDNLSLVLRSAEIPAERVMILRQGASLAVGALFGSSPRQLNKALRELGSSGAAGAIADSESQLALRQLQDLWRSSALQQGSAATGASAIPSLPAQAGGSSVLDRFRGAGGGAEGLGGDACLDFVTQATPLVVRYAQLQAQRTRATLVNLQRVGSLLAGVSGVKSLVYVGDSLEIDAGGALASYVNGLCPGQTSRLFADLNNESLNREFVDLTSELNARRVTVYALQSGGLTSSSLGDPSDGGFSGRPENSRARSAFDTLRRAEQREGLQWLAQQTGGQALLRRNDLAPAIEQLTRSLTPHYSIAYALPTNDGGKRKTHKIGIGVEQRGADVRFRRGYAELDAERQLIDRLDGALLLGLVDNPLGVRLGAGAITGDTASAFTMPLRISVPLAALVEAGRTAAGEPSAVLEVRVVARHLESQRLSIKENTFRAQLPAEPDDSLATLPVDLKLEAGAYTLAVAVEDLGSHRASFVTTDVNLGG